MDADGARKLLGWAEFIAGPFAFGFSVNVLLQNYYESRLLEILGLGASLVVYADGKIRTFKLRQSSEGKRLGVVEYAYGGSVRAGRYFYQRYRSWKEIREINAQAKKGEVYV